MAGDWIKMTVGLAEDPAVIGIASRLQVEEDLVVGKLHRFWCWADQKVEDGNASSVTTKWIDRYVQLEGFADALEKVGWLTASADGIAIPGFEKHMSQSAKRRALTARRVAQYKAEKGNAKVTLAALPREEKSRVEKKNKEASASLFAGEAENGSPAGVAPIDLIIDGGGAWRPSAILLAKLAAAYPAIDLQAELLKAALWTETNVSQRKTARGMPTFLRKWMAGAGRPPRNQTEKPKKLSARQLLQ